MLAADRTKIYARLCKVDLVSTELATEFINKYHLQGYAKSTINAGLFYNKELVAVMTFAKPRYNKNYQYELIRYCAAYNIIGGAEKLFKYFVNTYKPESIVSYCDLSKFQGRVYEQLGFRLKTNSIKPSLHWFNIKTKKHITDNLLRQRGYDQLFGTNYGKGTSNRDLMLASDFIEVYDCGQATYY